MFSNKNLAYILTTLEAIEKILLYTKDFKDPDTFYSSNDQLNFNATYTLLIVVSEESKKIEPLLKKEFGDIPWAKIAKFRNHLVHEYRGADPEIIFDIVRNYLPNLKSTLISMLRLVDVDRDELMKILKSDYYQHINYLIENK
jgi:uncharacterized protein with HEPN domain